MTTAATAAVRGVTGTDYRPVASYGRISKRTKGDGGGAYVKIENQHADNTAYIAALFPGAPVAYYDDNISAWDPAAVRPNWERMLSDIAAGNVRAVVAWHADRYTRQPSQLETMWETCKATGTEWHTVRSGHVTNPLMLRIEGALAANDSDLKSEKISRRHKTLAEEGKAHGGRRRFGYEAGMVAIHPVEGEILRDLCERFLAGESLYSLAASLKARGITGTSGATITGPNLRKLIGAPHLAGLRVHKLPNGTTTLYPGQWPAIISVTDHELITEKLADKSRRTAKGNARVHMLAGLMTCAACGAVLRGRPLHKGDGRAYACSTGRHCHRPTELVDFVVERLAIARLSLMDASGAFVDDAAIDSVARLELARESLKGKRRATSALWAADDITDAAYDARMAAIDEREAAVMAELGTARAAVRPLAELEGMTGRDVAEPAWQAATLDKRRAVLGVLFESLELVGAEHGRKAFTPKDVRYVFRTLPGSA